MLIVNAIHSSKMTNIFMTTVVFLSDFTVRIFSRVIPFLINALQTVVSRYFIAPGIFFVIISSTFRIHNLEDKMWTMSGSDIFFNEMENACTRGGEFMRMYV